MFGFGRRQDEYDAQVPYEVYASAQEPALRRRRWLLRLVGILAVVTLAVFGIATLRNNIRKTDNPATPNAGQGETKQPTGSTGPAGESGQPKSSAPAAVDQSPQQNNNLPTTGDNAVTVPQSGADNNNTVRKPE